MSDANSHSFKGQRCAFASRSTRFDFHPRRSVSSGAAEIALWKSVTYLNRYNVGRMLLAVILGRQAHRNGG
jgi:hypothetical protein